MSVLKTKTINKKITREIKGHHCWKTLDFFVDPFFNVFNSGPVISFPRIIDTPPFYVYGI